MTVSLLLAGVLLGGTASATWQNTVIQKVAAHANGSAHVWVTGSAFTECGGGAGRVHLGEPWQPAPAAMVAVALRARDRGLTVKIDLLISEFKDKSDGKNYCYADSIRDPA